MTNVKLALKILMEDDFTKGWVRMVEINKLNLQKGTCELLAVWLGKDGTNRVALISTRIENLAEEAARIKLYLTET